MPMPDKAPDGDLLLYVSHLKKHFRISKGLRSSKNRVRALDDVTFYLNENETLGIVGETGCGKTTLGRVIISTLEATDGDVYFNLPKERMREIKFLEEEYHTLSLKEKPTREEKKKLQELEQELEPLREKYSLTKLSRRGLMKYRREMQPVFQDPFGSLDPRRQIYKIISDPMKILTSMSKSEIDARVRELIKKIGLSDDHLFRLPHEFSGGQRQRIGVARAIAVNPKLLVMDEPTSALDVSIQAQILNMLKDIQQENGLSFIFNSLHLSVIRAMADRVAVMYLGKVVETGKTGNLFRNILHPYTKALFSAIPSPDPNTKRERIVLEGEVPSPANPPQGCYFHPRCPSAMEHCGWSPRDLSKPLSSLIESSPEYSKGEIPNVENLVGNEHTNELKIVFNDPLRKSHLAWIEGIIDRGRNMPGGVLFKAVKSVTPSENGKELVLSMLETTHPSLKEVEPGHFVSCFLYEDTPPAKEVKAETGPK